MHTRPGLCVLSHGTPAVRTTRHPARRPHWSHTPFTCGGQTGCRAALDAPARSPAAGCPGAGPRTLVDILRATADAHPDSPAVDNGREVLALREGHGFTPGAILRHAVWVA